jgi:hypothetical protein
MPTSDCPHNLRGIRSCIGCTPFRRNFGVAKCNGEVTGRVYSDSDGDGVWATPVWLAEIEDLSCGCQLSETEEQGICERWITDFADEGPLGIEDD